MYTPPPDIAPVRENEHDPGRILSLNSDTGVLNNPTQEIKLTRIQPKYTIEHLRKKQQEDRAYTIMIEAQKLPPDTSKLNQTVAISNLSETEKKWFSRNKKRMRLNESGILILHPERETEPTAIVVPDFYKFELMQETHELLAHQGAKNGRKTGETLPVARLSE